MSQLGCIGAGHKLQRQKGSWREKGKGKGPRGRRGGLGGQGRGRRRERQGRGHAQRGRVSQRHLFFKFLKARESKL